MEKIARRFAERSRRTKLGWTDSRIVGYSAGTMSAMNLKAKTKAELLKMAQRLGLRGISTMTKPKLVDTIGRAKQGRTTTFRKQAAIAVQKVATAIKRRAMRKPAKKVATAKAKTTVKKPTKVVSKKATAVAVAAATRQAAHKFDVAPVKKALKQIFKEENLGELPETYGTGRLFLAARDPHWLFAYWDFSHEQMAGFRRQASDGRMVLRVFEKNHATPVAELTLAHDARNWYLPANKAATSYSAELGFWRHDGSFNVVSRSREATTPPDALSVDTTAQFATIPVDVNFDELLTIVRHYLNDGEQLAEGLQRLQATGFQFPFRVDVELGPWSKEQAAQVEHILSGDVLRRVQVGSVELTEWLRRRLQGETSSGMFSGFSPSGSSWAGAPQKGFWFAVNAELIIYGATEPDAKVTVDGKSIALRTDGTFSFHWTFPDGKYRLPVVAASGKNGETRSVELQFERKTETHDDVGKVNQPAHLQPPVTK